MRTRDALAAQVGLEVGHEGSLIEGFRGLVPQPRRSLRRPPACAANVWPSPRQCLADIGRFRTKVGGTRAGIDGYAADSEPVTSLIRSTYGRPRSSSRNGSTSPQIWPMHWMCLRGVALQRISIIGVATGPESDRPNVALERAPLALI